MQVLQADIQRKNVENQIDFIKVNLEKMRTDSEITNNSVKTQSEMLKRNAEAVNALATAESKEAGINNPAYMQQAKDMNLFTNQQAKETQDVVSVTSERKHIFLFFRKKWHTAWEV